ncbi:putative kinesin [Leptomonas pyrrhocoris]|uniref:Putative kinesin n=1 Tax=Leptomonas pyrrhocoris TaxID=157538 RepID=A0A0M9FXQ1_LEPPY|nr:putative kinesin [Leptomonas pyrrhocoris]KPA78079.1 putative kinesin [Leptomonas pyrrhocoris]|eukprot:XP_015656518.1 putative kinesin [Leptomonas pyrrhocoris]
MDGEEPRVTVSVRVRPTLAFAANALQQSERYAEVVCIPTSDTSLRLAERRAAKVHRDVHFAYDHVFDGDTTQEEVYETAALDGVDGVLSGTNTSFLTYGQTGSGKTFTVLGKPAQGGEGGEAAAVVGPESGLLLRAIQDMLTYAERMRMKNERHVVLGITAVEIYNDEIRDLLREGSVSAALLQPIMTRDALHFRGLTHMPLRSLRDACAVYERAAARRVQRATSANDTSSRSHAIFAVEVFQTPMTPTCVRPPTLAECCAMRDAQVKAPGWPSTRSPVRCDCFVGAPNVLLCDDGRVPILYSVLTVVDLAGSEKAKHADVHGAGFDELRRINASLTALGNVVHHLYHNSAHIPYRDSKLTMVLRDTFAAPRARVVLFVNVSPTAITCDETLSSLYFADKMKGMAAPAAATSPQQAALQTSYLASLRLHDALVAEMHVFHAQQELSTGLLRRVASAAADHPLLQLPFHTALREGYDKADRLRRLCVQLKAEVELSESAEARMHRFAEVAQSELRKQLLMKYRQRRAEVPTLTAEVERANEALKKELVDTEAAMQQSLSTMKADTQTAAATRHELCQSTAAQKAQLEAFDNVAEVAPHGNTYDDAAFDGPVSIAGDFRKANLSDEAAGNAFQKALAAAKLRLRFVELVVFNVRTEPAPATPRDDGDGSEAASRTEKSRSRSGTAASTRKCDRKHASVEDWLRGAVLVMAGNAVVQSTRRKATTQAASSQPALGDVTNMLLAAPSQKKTLQLPKYWKVLQQQDASLRTANSSQAKKADLAAATVTGPAVGRFRSSFDDPGLLTRVTAYMDMGASLIKVDRSGRPRPQWFYVAQKEDRLMLCWDESRRGASLSGGGHVYLDAVAKLVLGRSSPGFVRYGNAAAAAPHPARRAATDEEVCNSFTVVYHSRSNHRDLKFVDVICPNRNEMETWVVGLAHWAKVSPLFEDSRQPDDAAEEAEEAKEEEEVCVTPVRLDAQEAVLSRVWHIPAEVLARTRQEIDARRSRHHSGKMRLTPGELRDLTGLDIFRASALWLHFEQQGWVANSTEKLCCFVDAEKPHESAKAAAATVE